MNGVEGQARWGAGAAAFWFDDPWLPGFARQSMAKIQDKVRVAPILVPSAGMERQSYASPSGGAFGLSSKSKHASQASALMADYFTTKEFSKGVAESSAVPMDLSVVAGANVHPA